MKLIVFFLSFFSFFSFAEVCVFKGKVHPESKYEEVSNLYKLSCDWFISKFMSSPDPEIVLTDVYYINKWSEVEFAEGRPSNILYGAFFKSKEKNTNVIYLELSKKAPYIKTDILDQSILFHELIHYFVKAASFDKLKHNNDSDRAMHEAMAYYAQDQFIQIMTEGKKTLFDFFDPTFAWLLISPDDFFFPDMAYILYINNPGSFILGAVQYFKTRPLDKYNMLVNGHYIKSSF